MAAPPPRLAGAAPAPALPAAPVGDSEPDRISASLHLTVAAIDQDNFVHASGVLVVYVPTYFWRGPSMAYVAISDTEFKGDIAMHTRHGLSPCKDACCETVCAQCSDLDGHVRRIVFLCLEVKSLRTLPRGSLDIR